MNDGMNKDDREFEDYLLGDSPLSREYARRRNDEPPGSLDAAVLASARRAAAFDRRRARYRRVRRWGGSVAAAAVVVLGLTLVLEITIFGGSDPSAPPQSRRPVSLAPQALHEPAPAQDRAGVAEETARQEVQRMPAAPPPEPAADNRKQTATESRAAAREEAVASAADAAQPQLPARPASAEQAGAAEPATEEKELQRARTADSRLAAEDRYATPEDWLAGIRRLQQAGRTEAAREALDAFRTTYPEHELPADLATLAEPGE